MKDKMQNKLKELIKLRAETVAQVNAINGAIQVLEELLKDEVENG